MSVDFREKMHDVMVESLADQAKHHNYTYEAVRPMFMPVRPYTVGTRKKGDCSKYCQYLVWWAGGPDPMGLGFNGYGNSSTLCHNLQHLDSAKELMVGDFVTFGKAGRDHAACVMEADHVHGNPLLASWGHQGAPNTYRLDFDTRPKQFLRNPLPKYIPTPQDKLRSKTGYFAWVAWKIGEGDWHGHGQANPKVRPNVPKNIALAHPLWWKRYAQFIAGRKKGDKANG